LLTLAIAASFKTVALSQNSLRPYEIQELSLKSANLFPKDLMALIAWWRFGYEYSFVLKHE
jgi:hypothetical protein